MFVGSIRPARTQQLTVEAGSLAEVHDALRTQTPAGFELAAAPVSMRASSETLSAAATFVQRDGVRQIEAESVEGLRALVPEGWQMLAIRRV